VPAATQAAPSPEVTPSMDESRPQIGPNLAGDEELAKAVAEHIYRDFAYPALLQQQTLWDTWDRIDDAFRVREKACNLDISPADPALKPTTPDGRGSGMVDPRDGLGAKITPAAMHKQIVSKTDMHMSLAWADFPVRAQKPETLYEHPLYNPTQQGVDAANELLRQNARDINMQDRDRVGRGCFAKYGHAWATVDFQYETEDVEEAHALPNDAQQTAMMVQALMAQYPGQTGEQQVRMGVPYLVFLRKIVKTMQTDYRPVRQDDVLIDQTVSCSPIESQLCPGVRSHVTRADLFGNDYDPTDRPFGWLNCQRAMAEKLDHFTLSATDEGQFRRELCKKNNLQESTNLKPRNSRKQLWTFYPMLAIDSTPDPTTGAAKKRLDTGEGLECATCQGRKELVTEAGNATCPTCNGAGKVFIRPVRHVVQMFGNLMLGGEGSVTVLRIQKNPTVKDKVPILFAAHLTEDTAGAIPLCKSEAALNAHVQLTTSLNQWYDAKNQMINRPWLVQEDSPALHMNLNRPGRNIPVNGLNQAMPMPTISFDITQNLQPWIGHNENEIQLIHGMNDQLLGEVSAGRRAATEIQNAFDAAKLPIVVEVDSYNRQMPGGWAWFALQNIEAWADRDWIRRKTGRTTFGKVEIFTQTADEFMKRMGLIQNMRYVLEASAQDPSINRQVLWAGLLQQMNMPNAEQIVNDGVRKAQMDAFKIGMAILGDGQWQPPQMSDPHDIYLTIFEQMIQDTELTNKAPQNVPLMQQRISMQGQMQMMQQIQQQQQQLLMQGPQVPGLPTQQQPATPGRIPENPTQANQALMGAMGGG
jgi:hypothetical protein